MPVALIGNIRGPQGNQGIQGPAGPDGVGFNFKGSVANDAALQALTGMDEGDVYQVLDTGHAWQYDGTTWRDTGPYRGSQGPQGVQGPEGPAGTGFNMKGSVADQAELDAITGQDIGDAYYREDTGTLVYWDGSAWIDVGEIRGPEGPQGIQGPPGTDGTAGSNGAPGVRGTAWWFQAGTPSDPLTDDFPGALSGDVVVDTDTWNMYQWTDGTRRAAPRAPAAPRPPVVRR